MDCAATVPIISPGSASACLNRSSTSPSTHANAAAFSRYSRSTRLAASLDRSSTLNSTVAFFCASALSRSSPGTTTSLCTSSFTDAQMALGSSASPLASPSPPGRARTAPMRNFFCAFHTMRLMFTGSGMVSSPVSSTARAAARSASSVSYSSASASAASRTSAAAAALPSVSASRRSAPSSL